MNSEKKSAQPTIQIQNLHHSFGKGSLQIPVLNDINLEISAGEITILMGPSGSGKTTLLTLIGALRSMQTGSLKVLNRELLGAKKSQLVQTRSNIGYIFQAHNLLKSLTAWENVTMPLKLHPHIKDRQHRAINILTAVGLAERTHYYPDNLSGGQKQHGTAHLRGSQARDEVKASVWAVRQAHVDDQRVELEAFGQRLRLNRTLGFVHDVPCFAQTSAQASADVAVILED